MKMLLAAGAAAALVLAGCASDSDGTRGAEDDESAGAVSAAYVDATGNCAGLANCFKDVQSALDAVKGVPNATVSVFAGTYNIPQTADPANDPGLTISAPVTLIGYDSDDCQETNSCPTINFEGITSTGVEVQASDVAIENLALTQKQVPSSTPGGRLIELPQADPTTLYENFTLNEAVLTGGLRGVRLSGANVSVSSSIFSDQAADAMLIPTLQGVSAIEGNFFSGATSSKKAINLEQQYQSAPPSGSITIDHNTSSGKNNFVVWNIWPTDPGDVSLNISHNTSEGLGGPAVSFYETAGGSFKQFSSVVIDSNIWQRTGGNGVIVDYTTAGSAGGVPSKGQLQAGNNLAYQVPGSKGATNDKSGVYGFGYEPNEPKGANLSMYSLQSNIDNKDPLLGAAPDYALGDGSPAIGQGSGGTNIGAWQGSAPVIKSVRPTCGKAGQNMKITGSNLQDATVVVIGDQKITTFKEKKGTRIQLKIPAASSGSTAPVDVSVSSPAGTGTLIDAFRYAKKNSC